MRPSIQATPSRIHLIEREDRFIRVEGDVWDSGFWHLPERTARQLVGGTIYFHKTQRGPSFFGGRILSCRIETEGEFKGRIIFRFEFTNESKGFRAGREGWAQEMKLALTE